MWLGWFLHTILWEFAKIADARGESKRAETWRLHVSALKAALEREGWDGGWYRRAYLRRRHAARLGREYGMPHRFHRAILGSDQRRGGTGTGGARHGGSQPAAGAPADGLILLLTPPFDHTPLDPGYIKGYVPGIRENGGQYTHAAVWTVMAFAALGDGDKAGELLRMLNPIQSLELARGRAAI